MSTVLVYSDDPAVRERVRMAVGRRPDPSMDPIEWLEADDGGALVTRVDEGGIDVCILDGEAAPEGGMGLSRQLKNEIADCPAMLLLVMRRDDQWLARWSLADATVRMPIDPVELTAVLVELLRARAKPLPAPAAGDELAARH
jgi:DNA-binding response OmpR family regulator